MKFKTGSTTWKVLVFSLVAFLVSAFFLIELLQVNTTVSSVLGIPAPTSLVPASKAFDLPVLKGISLDPNNPLNIDFIIDAGDSEEINKDDVSRLVKYFLAALTVPQSSLWVNLSPYERDRIIDDSLGITDLGKDMLAQDYVLKQLISTLTCPNEKTGEQYWNEIYSKVIAISGTNNIPIDTFNKVWIVPGDIEVNQHQNTALINQAKLKVILEEDYLANSINHQVESGDTSTSNKDIVIRKAVSDVMRKIVVPEIEDDVNNGKNFSVLRQVYHSLILALWFKEKFMESFYAHYIDKNEIKGLDLADKDARDKIYQTYVEAFEKGVYNIVKKEYDFRTNKKINRRYFSGGENFTSENLDIASSVVNKSLNDMADLFNSSFAEQSLFKSTIKLNAVKAQPPFTTRLQENKPLSADKRAEVNHVYFEIQGNSLSWPLLQTSALLGRIEELFPNAQISIIKAKDQSVVDLYDFGPRVKVDNSQRIDFEKVVPGSVLFTTFRMERKYPKGVTVVGLFHDSISIRSKEINKRYKNSESEGVSDNRVGGYHKYINDALVQMGLLSVESKEIFIDKVSYSDRLKIKIRQIEQLHFPNGVDKPLIMFNVFHGAGFYRNGRSKEFWQELIKKTVVENPDSYFYINKSRSTTKFSTMSTDNNDARDDIKEIYHYLRKEFPDKISQFIEVEPDQDKDMVRLSAILALSDMVITENSGVAHLAEAMRKPTASFVKDNFKKFFRTEKSLLSDNNWEEELSTFIQENKNLKYKEAALASDKYGGVDLKNTNINILGNSLSSALMQAPFDIKNFGGFVFDVVRLDQVTSEDELALFIK